MAARPALPNFMHSLEKVWIGRSTPSTGCSEGPVRPGRGRVIGILSAAGATFLDGRTWHSSVRAIHATVTGFGLQDRAARFALVEPLAALRWHVLCRRIPTLRASDGAFEDYRCPFHPRALAQIRSHIEVEDRLGQTSNVFHRRKPRLLSKTKSGRWLKVCFVPQS